MIVYTKLWILLEKKGMKKTDLKKIMSSATLAKLGKNEPVSSGITLRFFRMSTGRYNGKCHEGRYKKSHGNHE